MDSPPWAIHCLCVTVHLARHSWVVSSVRLWAIKLLCTSVRRLFFKLAVLISLSEYSGMQGHTGSAQLCETAGQVSRQSCLLCPVAVACESYFCLILAIGWQCHYDFFYFNQSDHLSLCWFALKMFFSFQQDQKERDSGCWRWKDPFLMDYTYLITS